MDDDGRSGRWMARGNMGKLTHLEAFLSDDAKRGRVWTCGKIEYKRGQTQWPEVMYREAGCSVWNNYPWQLAESTEPVHWADEPKTLTPQEALRALADGKTIDGGDVFVRLDTDSAQLVWNDKDDNKWTACGLMAFCGYRIVPDPSQPAEPQVEYPLTYAQAARAALDYGAVVANDRTPQYEYWVSRGFYLRRVGSYTNGGWILDAEEKNDARWRIVDGGK